MIDDINTKRTELANNFAAAGAALLDFTGTACALAAVPDTEPQQYAAVGTPENIAAILPATITPQRRQKHGERPSADSLEWGDSAGEAAQPASSDDLPPLPHTYYNGYSDGSEPLYTAEQMRDYGDLCRHFARPAATSGDAPADLQQLKALALAATPGPWRAAHWNGHAETTVMRAGDTTVIAETTGFGRDSSECVPDAAFIAAANPAVILDLIARIERAAAPAPSELPKIEGAQEAREFVDAWHRKHFPTDRTFSRYILGTQGDRSKLAGDFAWQLANALQTMESRAAAPATASGDERAMFEFAERASNLARCEVDGELYANPCVQSAWEGWQARAALSAAKVPAEQIAERALFEREALRLDIVDDEGLKRDAAGDYIDEPAQAAWKAWQAASTVPAATDLIASGLREIIASAGDKPETSYIRALASDMLASTVPAAGVPDIDDLAQFIRKIDGNHSMGAGALAEKIVEWLVASRRAAPADEVRNAAPTDEQIKAAIIAALESHETEMEGYAYFGSNPGVKRDDYEDIADDAIRALRSPASNSQEGGA